MANAMAYRWETPASVWLEDDTSGQFELAASAGLSRIDWQAQARDRLPDVAHVLGASLPGACRCAPIFPEGFAYCPNCGQALVRLDRQPKSQPDWRGLHADGKLPRHVPHGLALTSFALGAGLERRAPAPVVARPDRTLPAPPNARCVFAAGSYGFPTQRLLALAPGRNLLQYWDPLAARWHVMLAEKAPLELSFTAADYGWLPAHRPQRGEVALVPTDRGLRHLWINPVSETCRTESVFDAALASAPGIVLGNLGRLGHLGCLFNDAGNLRLWSARCDLSQVELHDCPGAPVAGWSRPVSYIDHLFWLHPHGQLRWQPGGAPCWIAWPQGWSPCLELGGPTPSRDGRLWQLGHDAQGYSMLELGTPAPQREALDGARLGFGGFLFRRGHAVRGEPWQGEHVEEQQHDDALVLPLLRQFDHAGGAPSGLVLRFHHYTGKAEHALDGSGVEIGRTTLEWIGQHNVVLDELVRLKRPLECVLFVYDNCLWLHHPDWDRMRGWRLAEPA
jgi:hypothetical protein